MTKIFIGIGIPGSGKTTVLKAFAENNSYTYISPDEIRAELTGDMSNQTQNKQVWEEAHRRVAKSLKNQETVVFDATFTKHHERKKFIQFAREHGATTVEGIYADVPIEIALERNQKRSRVVLDHAIKNMYMLLEKNPPTTREGFDRITLIDQLNIL